MPYPTEGKSYKVYRIRDDKYIGHGVAHSVSEDSNYGFTAFMEPFELADGTRADGAEFLGGVYRFEEVTRGGRRNKKTIRRARRHRKTRRSSRKSRTK